MRARNDGRHPASEEVMSLQRPIPSLARPCRASPRSPLPCAGPCSACRRSAPACSAAAWPTRRASASTARLPAWTTPRRAATTSRRVRWAPPGRLRQPVGPAAVLRPRADPRPHRAGAQGPLQRTGRLAASAVEHRPAGRGGNLRRLPAGRAAHVRRSPGRPVAGGGLGRRAGRSAEGNLYRAALVGVPLQRRHRPLRPGFRG